MTASARTDKNRTKADFRTDNPLHIFSTRQNATEHNTLKYNAFSPHGMCDESRTEKLDFLL
jgi:hypothetical protein